MGEQLLYFRAHRVIQRILLLLSLSRSEARSAFLTNVQTLSSEEVDERA